MDGPDAAALGAAPGLLRGDAPPPRRPVLTLVALSAVVSVVFLAFMLAATQGTFVPQVVDVYLVCQYARAIVEGHPFRYGSDIALFLLLALWLLERWLASADAGVPLWTAPGVLLALARPEGLPIALALAAAWMRLSERETSPRRDLRPWLPVVAGLA